MAAPSEDSSPTPAEEPAAALEADNSTDKAAAPFVEEPKASAAEEKVSLVTVSSFSSDQRMRLTKSYAKALCVQYLQKDAIAASRWHVTSNSYFHISLQSSIFKSYLGF